MPLGILPNGMMQCLMEFVVSPPLEVPYLYSRLSSCHLEVVDGPGPPANFSMVEINYKSSIGLLFLAMVGV